MPAHLKEWSCPGLVDRLGLLVSSGDSRPPFAVDRGERVEGIRIDGNNLAIFECPQQARLQIKRQLPSFIDLEPISKPPETRINKGENRGLEIGS
jgi:hypothetical protein